MNDTTSPVPFPVTPMLCVAGAADALPFYADAFGAIETTRMTDTDGP